MNINQENLQKLIDFMESSDTYHQNNYFHKGSEHPCGTPACVAGHCYILFGRVYSDELKADPWDFSQKTLGLSDDQAEDLFCMRENPIPTKKDVIEVLENLKDTKKVEWPDGSRL